MPARPSARRGAAALLAACAVLLVGAGGCSGAPALQEPPESLVIAAGEPSGVYLRYGEGLAAALSQELPATEVRAAATSGSVDNIERLAEGRAQVAFALADTAAEAVAGTGPFAGEPVRLRALARLYTNSVHVVVPAGSPAERVADLDGQRVSVGAVGSGTELTATRLLAVAGARPRVEEHLGVQESAAALADGRLDAFFWSGGLPTRGISDLVQSTDVRLLATDDLLAAMRADHGEHVVEQTIPTSVYGTVGDVSTLGVPNLLLVREDMPDELAQAVTAGLFASRDVLVAAHPEARRLDQRSAITTTPVELHPGAAAYYRSAKPGASTG